MTVIYDMATTESFSKEVREHIEANLHRLQQTRLDTLNNATLEDVFKDRNPYLLRATRKVAFELLRHCLDNYLLSVDEILFSNFSREVSAFMARRSQQLLEPATILELFAQDNLPLRIELLEAYDRAINRLTYQFSLEFCDEEANIDWEQLTRFIFSFEKKVHSREADDISA